MTPLSGDQRKRTVTLNKMMYFPGFEHYWKDLDTKKLNDYLKSLPLFPATSDL